MTRVLRLKIGDRVILLDGKGGACFSFINRLGEGQIEFELEEPLIDNKEAPIRITLAQSLIKKDNFEFVLQKGTELGATEFYPLISQRTEVNLLNKSDKKVSKKLTRWREIVKNAAEQCQRQVLPLIHYPVNFEKYLKNNNENSNNNGSRLKIMCHEQENTPLKKVLKTIETPPSSAIILIGPEGGFSHNEVDLAREQGFSSVSMGPRILRAETAGIVAVSAILYELADLGGTEQCQTYQG
ncbi:protein of unknown function DUF558 [Natranaerobius thermophilus JW/NM-WN-LF]|uniref:Ribosomal RNA small subunit methyltransferase E n=1 Tax=Natranaerobius thermophilus (strain ATCC BAA-1301 / DSM 18059 / JW/NM-WN-LF) TaxID=457570 RepID=B2A1N2_NATTJ|nr:protein of unknown function DUF558 [Natranaerobius thermophilus JW/NM-WN-LF]